MFNLSRRVCSVSGCSVAESLPAFFASVDRITGVPRWRDPHLTSVLPHALAAVMSLRRGAAHRISDDDLADRWYAAGYLAKLIIR